MNKCSTCRGYNTIVDVDGEEKAYDCPMCAGSGLASDEADTLAWYDSGCPADSERSILTDLLARMTARREVTPVTITDVRKRRRCAVARPSERPTAEQIELAEAQIVEQSKRIDFFLTEYSVEILAQKVRDGEYVVPAYQREFTWEDRRKSRFIESLIMGLPIPFIFFWEMPDGKLEIVDGSQRLRTIEEFIYGGFQLGDLDPLTHLSGFRFDDLPESRQRKIKDRSVRGIVLNEHADEAARLDVFERINTGSKNANNAEIRRGALADPARLYLSDGTSREVEW